VNYELATQSFLNHLQIEKGLAKNTISAYRRDLTKFGLFLNGQNLSSITPADITKFEVALRREKLSVGTINRIDSTLRSFFRHLQIEHGLTDPTLELVTGKNVRRLPKAISVDQMSAIITASYRQSEPITSRDRAIVEVLYASGARVSELISIDVADLVSKDVEGETVTTLKLRGKGGKERIVPLGSFAKSAIEDYLVRVRPGLLEKAARSSNALFLNSRGSRISRQSIWQIVLDATKAAGIKQEVSPHTFRHSYATHLLDGGADIRVVQELLGHSSVTTTQIYTLISIDKIQQTYITAHPRAQ
jgi:integrase/recombinase XerD